MAGGFTTRDVDTLTAIKHDVQKSMTYITDQDKWRMVDYWESDQVLLPTVLNNKRIATDCEEMAMVSMRKAIDAGYKARLIICLDEIKEGHCICEVVSADGTQAYYFDNRRLGISTQQGLTGYFFYSGSPWNPQPGDQRPWVLINKQAS